MTRLISTAIALILLLPSFGSLADASREYRIERELERVKVADGRLVRLNTGNRNFVALHLPSHRPPARGAILLLHDAWGNADSPEIVRPLRQGLARAGWETLALQLPPAYDGENAAAWVARNQTIGERIDAARQWLQTRRLNDPVLVAPGASAELAMSYATKLKPDDLRALVLISSHATFTPEHREAIIKNGLPVLDLVAGYDDPTILDAALTRAQSAAVTNEMVLESRHLVGARPGFRNNGNALVTEIRAWLTANTKP